MNETIPSISIAGAPVIDFRFAGDVCVAELEGARLRAEMKSDDTCDVRIHAADGKCLADIVVRVREPDDNLSESLMSVGSALLWSYWRYVEAKRAAADVEEKAP